MTPALALIAAYLIGGIPFGYLLVKLKTGEDVRAAGSGNIGRTAGAWLGAVTLGQRNAPYAKMMEGYVRSHAGEVFGGPASLMREVPLAGTDRTPARRRRIFTACPSTPPGAASPSSMASAPPSPSPAPC